MSGSFPIEGRAKGSLADSPGLKMESPIIESTKSEAATAAGTKAYCRRGAGPAAAGAAVPLAVETARAIRGESWGLSQLFRGAGAAFEISFQTFHCPRPP